MTVMRCGILPRGHTTANAIHPSIATPTAILRMLPSMPHPDSRVSTSVPQPICKAVLTATQSPSNSPRRCIDTALPSATQAHAASTTTSISPRRANPDTGTQATSNHAAMVALRSWRGQPSNGGRICATSRKSTAGISPMRTHACTRLNTLSTCYPSSCHCIHTDQINTPLKPIASHGRCATIRCVASANPNAAPLYSVP